jgi:hypothetical protein
MQETLHGKPFEHDLLGLTAAMFGLRNKNYRIKNMINFVTYMSNS